MRGAAQGSARTSTSTTSTATAALSAISPPLRTMIRSPAWAESRPKCSIWARADRIRWSSMVATACRMGGASPSALVDSATAHRSALRKSFQASIGTSGGVCHPVDRTWRAQVRSLSASTTRSMKQKWPGHVVLATLTTTRCVCASSLCLSYLLLTCSKWVGLRMIDEGPVIQIGDMNRNVFDEVVDLGHVLVVDLLRLVRDVMVVRMAPGCDEGDLDAVAGVLVVIGPAVDVRRMTVRVL